METISKLCKDKKTESSWYGFTKKKACLVHPLAFYNEVTSLVDEGKVVRVVYLDFKTAFLHWLIEKLLKY